MRRVRRNCSNRICGARGGGSETAAEALRSAHSSLAVGDWLLLLRDERKSYRRDITAASVWNRSG